MSQRKKSKLRVKLEGDELRLRARRGSCAIAAFMTIWMAGWSVGCSFMITKFHWDMPLEDLIFPIPFLVGWVFGALMWVSMLLANEELSLGPDGVRYRLRLSFIPTQRRNLPLSDLKDVDSFTDVEGSGDDRNITHGVELRTYGAPLRFGQALSQDDRSEAVRVVGKHLKMLKSLRSSASERHEAAIQTAEDGLFATSSTSGPQARSGGLLLDGPSGTFERPSECCYRLNRTFDGVDFVWRGKPMFLGSLAILALNLFWNTIVIVFALQLFKDFRLDHFLFLIPFEIIGLAMFIGFLAALFQPFFQERWRLTRAEIEHRFTVFWIGPRWHYEVIPLSHLELRRDEDSQKPFWERGKKNEDQAALEKAAEKSRRKRGMTGPVRRSINLKPSQFGRDFMLEFVATDGEPLCSIKHLHEGEARWIADVVRGEFPGWFSR